MKTKIKIITIICLVIILIFSFTYYNFCVYGSYVSTYSLFDYKAEVNDGVVHVTADTACSGNAFAGYDTVWIVDELQIKPRYSLVSKFNQSGKMDIVYDAKDRPLHKIYLVGAEEEDKIQIWPVDEIVSYQVVTTDHFTVEIPEGWNATANQDAAPLLLNLSNEAGAVRGSIEMLPEGADLIPLPTSDSFRQKIHVNAENGQQTIVTILCTDEIDKNRAIVIADKIADSIKDTPTTEQKE